MTENQKCKVLKRLFDSRYPKLLLTVSWLIGAHLAWRVSGEPCNTSQICTTAPNSIFSCSAVFSPVRQTDCMSGMCECAGHLQFYTMLSDQSGGWCWRVTGRVLRAAGLSGQVRTVQHGCHQGIPRVCSRWMMASHWSHRAVQYPETRLDLDCISNKCCFSASCMMPGDSGLQMEDMYNQRWTKYSDLSLKYE